MSLSRERRLRKSADYRAARRDGRSWADGTLVLNARANDSETSRFGFTVSKRVGNAVARNRIRRRLKAATADTGIADGWDLVFIARRRAADADYWTLRRSLRRLVRRAGLASPNQRNRKGG